jgi:hypothetical protein
MKNNPMIGRTIREIYLADNGGAIRFVLDGGDIVEPWADGYCCSHSWVESIDTPDAIVGGVVTKVEDIHMPELPYDENEHQCLRFYGCRITTDRGQAVIDYRNSSNGYYGGSLEWPSTVSAKPEHFYGGVHGQNGPKKDCRWKKLAGGEHHDE